MIKYLPFLLFLLLMCPMEMARAEEFRLKPGSYSSLEAGVFSLDGEEVRLAFIDPAKRREECKRSGRTYLCGFYAWQAWSSVIAGKELSCVKASGADGSVCKLPDGTDLGLWLVESGFARILAGAPARYVQAEARSKAENKGIFSRP
jgi:endonuclease YncB( thermonuclease family)